MKAFMKVIRQILHSIAMIMVPKFIRKKMRSCKEVAILIANNDQNSALIKLQIRLHTMMCQGCYDYQQQLDLIRSSSNKLKDIELKPEQLEKIRNSKSLLQEKFGKK
jgi:hypothetical protein